METRLLVLSEEKSYGCDYTTACGKNYQYKTIDENKQTIEDYIERLALLNFSKQGNLEDFISENDLEDEDEITIDLIVNTIASDYEGDSFRAFSELIVINLKTAEEYNVDLSKYKSIILEAREELLNKKEIEEAEAEFKRLAEKLGKKI